MNSALLVNLPPVSENAPPPDQHVQIADFTSNAERLLARGSVEDAFNALLHAYLIDPTAPEVLACEQHVLPAWERLRKTSLRPEARPSRTMHSTQTTMSSSLFDRLKQGNFLR